MSVPKQDIVIFQGDDYSQTFGLTDANGWPAVLTDNGTLGGAPFTATAQLRRNYADTDTTIDATFGTTVQPVGSRVTLSLNAATTLGLVNGPYQYDIQVTNPTTSVKTTVVRGLAHVQLEVTR